jgi:hypothetical protein
MSFARTGFHANVLSTHSFFMIKFEDSRYRLTFRLMPYGNQDQEKCELGKDSSAAESSVIRLVLVIAMLLKFTVGSIDVIPHTCTLDF